MLEIGYKFDFVVDSRLLGKEVNHGTTLEGGGVSLWILLLTDTGILCFYLFG